MNPNITIYNASAGAGKTYTLAKRYIELLLENPDNYRHTLAVTFTNKATEEMKERILEQLYALWKGLDPEFMQDICKDLEPLEQFEPFRPLEPFIAKRCGTALSLLLHDYSLFQVQTIDAFFQRVMRNLARELELPANMKVELGDKEREGLAVDNLVNELNEGDEKLKWILSFIDEKILEDKSWDVIRDIKEFGTKILSDEYRQNAEALKSKFEVKNFFQNLRKQLQELADGTEQKMKQYAEEFFSAIEKQGFSADSFSGGNRSAASYFIKLQKGEYSGNPGPFNATAEKAALGPEGWAGKKRGVENTPLYAFARDVLVPLINKAETDRKLMAPKAASARLVLQNLNQLRLLYFISLKMHEMNTDENSIMLSDTQTMLNDLMKDSDTPFVFEKIGARLRNIMIDEFQDTSTTQWLNFRKLIRECLSQSGSQNLVVGDIKQSIYRWRNGDWRLLHGLQEDDYLRAYKPLPLPLNTNFRSEERIIQFNNKFFVEAALAEQAQLAAEGNPDAPLVSQIYSEDGVHQEIDPKKTDHNGFIEISLLPSDNYKEETISLVEKQIQDIAAAGGKDEDIAILVRSNANISMLAQQLQQDMPDHQFISDEAFRLYSSPEVSSVINAMRLLINPDSKLLQAQLEVQEDKSSKVKELIERRDSLLSLPLIDLIYELTSTMHISQTAFIIQLMDCVSDFCQQNIPDIATFLAQWDENISQKSVQGGDIKGIRLLTIHKSKGLQYESVIIPFCDWPLYLGSTVWCTSDIEPFSSLPVIPLLSKRLKGTIYSAEYNYEHLQDCIDNLNLLYVAFTRAKRNLYVIGKLDDKKSYSTRSRVLQVVLPDLTTQFPDATWEDNVFTWGSLSVKVKGTVKAEKAENVFKTKSTPLMVQASCACKAPEFIQSNASKRFLSTEDENTTSQENGGIFITLGIAMHALLSEIHGLSEAEGKLEEFVQSGVVSTNGKGLSREQMAHLIETRLLSNRNPLIKEWFAEDVHVMNECSILTIDAEGCLVQKRPDRVIEKDGNFTVIDFKFSTPREAHISQVREYMDLISEMGNKNVSGYLWYIYQNKVIEVKA